MLLYTRDVPASGYFTPIVNKKYFFFDVGIGTTDFSFVFNVQQYNGRAKVKVTYGSTVIGQTDDWTAGLFYIEGQVTTDSGQQEANIIQVEIETDVVETDLSWICVVTFGFKANNEDSPAPLPYRVRNNTTGTARLETVEPPAWVTPEPTIPTTTASLTPFDPNAGKITLFPPIPTIDPNNVGGGGDTGDGPPGPPPTFLPGQEPGNEPPPDATEGPTPTFPPTETTTPEPTVEATTEPTTAPLVLTVKARHALEDNSGGGTDYTTTDLVEITSGNKSTFFDVGPKLNKYDVRYLNPIYTALADIHDAVQFSGDSFVLFLDCTVSGGSGNYRFKVKNTPPELISVRYANVADHLVTGYDGEVPADSSSYEYTTPDDFVVVDDTSHLDSQYASTGRWFYNNGTYSYHTLMRVTVDDAVRCLGLNEPYTKPISIEVDDGFSTVSLNDIQIYNTDIYNEQSDNYQIVIPGVDTSTNIPNNTRPISVIPPDSSTPGYVYNWIDVVVNANLLVTSDLVFKFEDTQPDYSYVHMINHLEVSDWVDFGNGRRHSSFREELCPVQKYYRMENGKVYSRVFINHPGSHVYNTHTNNYWSYAHCSRYGGCWFQHFYENYCPHPTGVFAVYLKNKTTLEETLLLKKLLWYSTGPYAQLHNYDYVYSTASHYRYQEARRKTYSNDYTYPEHLQNIP